MRSRTSIKSEDDLPPPYEAQVSPELAQQSPPPYHVAISMEDDEADDDDDQEGPDVASNVPNGEDDDNDETDSKVNFAKKKVVVRLSKVNK